MSSELDLSVIIISYNMKRELPRTIKSFSPAMQIGIDSSQYEIILVDNGSAIPPKSSDFDCNNLHVYSMPDPAPSPVAAINLGLSLARGRFVGVCIDGARMASPGLLALALRAEKLAERPVVGTIAFHLGPEVQSKSILNGYNHDVEDTLLKQAAWEENGYNLFEISSYASSSIGGWFDLPQETNALFLKREHWIELGGYDTRFKTGGGGLVNLHMWSKLCEESPSQVVMLLGESTFHQIHGGISTNSTQSKWDYFHAEYVDILGHPYKRPIISPLFFGRLPVQCCRPVAQTSAPQKKKRKIFRILSSIFQ